MTPRICQDDLSLKFPEISLFFSKSRNFSGKISNFPPRLLVKLLVTSYYVIIYQNFSWHCIRYFNLPRTLIVGKPIVSLWCYMYCKLWMVSKTSVKDRYRHYLKRLPTNPICHLKVELCESESGQLDSSRLECVWKSNPTTDWAKIAFDAEEDVSSNDSEGTLPTQGLWLMNTESDC